MTRKVSERKPRPTAIMRFAKFCRHDPVTDCVIWTGYTYKGYGYFHWDAVRGHGLAHRWAAIHILGLPVTSEFDVDHVCRNKLCQSHLRLLYPRINRGWDEDETEWMDLEEEDGVPFYLPPAWLVQASSDLFALTGQRTPTTAVSQQFAACPF